MSVKLLIGMNLSPKWVPFFQAAVWTAVHWSAIGSVDAPDDEIGAWARANDFVVFTNDLDFGTLLALTRVHGPSVIQTRTNDVLPSVIGDTIVAAIAQHESELAAGAFVIIDESRSRVRVLPI